MVFGSWFLVGLRAWAGFEGLAGRCEGWRMEVGGGSFEGFENGVQSELRFLWGWRGDR